MARLYTLPLTATADHLRAPFRVGSGASFTALVEQYQAMVFSIAFRFFRCRETAEELSQDVFLELYRSQPVFDSPAHVAFWLRKTASHRCIDLGRRRKLRPRLGLQQVPEPTVCAPETDPLLQRAITGMLDDLAETPRLVMILRYQEDLDPAEIAAILDMPVATVKSHLQRSVAALRSKLRGER